MHGIVTVVSTPKRVCTILISEYRSSQFFYLFHLSLGTQPVGVQCIFSPFSISWFLPSSPLYRCHWTFLCFFLDDRSICSLGPLFLTLDEFQAWDWLQYPLTCGPGCGIGVRMKQKSQSKFLPRPRFELRTSRLAVQHATARQPRVFSCHLVPSIRWILATVMAILLYTSLDPRRIPQPRLVHQWHRVYFLHPSIHLFLFLLLYPHDGIISFSRLFARMGPKRKYERRTTLGKRPSFFYLEYLLLISKKFDNIPIIFTLLYFSLALRPHCLIEVGLGVD